MCYIGGELGLGRPVPRRAGRLPRRSQGDAAGADIAVLVVTAMDHSDGRPSASSPMRTEFALYVHSQVEICRY